MSDTFPCVTPLDLTEHPELAVLEILTSALDTTKFAIIAAHPELDDADPDTPPTDVEVLAAEHIIIAANAMKHVIASYRGAIRAREAQHWSHRSLRCGADDPF